jgi:hypothetical protein
MPTKYQALINLSVPRKGDPQKQVDLVMAGETVELDDDVAQQFLRHDPRAGRQVEVIRKVTGAAGEMPRVPPRAVSGRLAGPPQGARPDPKGSSQIQMIETMPEAHEPQPGTENFTEVDAEDIAPRASRARAGAGAK